MPRTSRPTEYYLHTLPGIEGIAWEEVQERVDAATLEGFKVVPGRNGIVLFSTLAEPSVLTSVRTAEDLFWAVARVPDVPWGREGLSMMSEQLMQGLSLNHGLNLLGSLRTMPSAKPVTFRVISRMVGKNQPYWRSELADMVTRVVRNRTRRQWRAVREGEQVEIWANLLGRELLVGMRLSDESMRHRPYQQVHLPASLRPSMAAALVRLTEPAADDVFLDPLCGTGTLLIERGLYGRHGLLIGGDIETAAVMASQENIGPRHKPRELLLWDAKRIPLADGSVDTIASNLPFGKQLSRPRDLPVLYRGLCAEIARVLRPRGRAVLLTSEIRRLRTAIEEQQGLGLRRSYSVTLLGQSATIQIVERSPSYSQEQEV
jgi:tRNA (guanine6-N2)-methyltransferase